MWQTQTDSVNGAAEGYEFCQAYWEKWKYRAITQAQAHSGYNHASIADCGEILGSTVVLRRLWF